MEKYDYIITGGGAAGLSLLVHMIRSGKFKDKQILLVEKDAHKGNDRTWCFWETGPGTFEDVVYKKYKKLWFHGDDYSSLNDIQPYTYKLIRGKDFYAYCHQLIEKQSNIQVVTGAVTEMDSTPGGTYVMVDKQQYFCEFIFNSILFEKPVMKPGEYFMLQHFVGWVINTDDARFNTEEATFMDFRVNQKHGTTFFYVMPFSANQALVEYTFFSPAILPDHEYEEGLKNYIADILKLEEYTVTEVEKGSIPMTNFKFKRYSNNIVNLGTAGGDTKASSGYTFNFIQKRCEKIIQALDQTGNPFIEEPIAERRFLFYDTTLLNILYNRTEEGAYIFRQLSRYNDMRTVLKFLDNETTVAQELKLISVLPTLKFMKAAAQQFL